MGETNEVLDLHIGSSNLGNNSLVFVENSLETISVKVDKLDAFSFKEINLIKIDVEGFEMEVINGGNQTIDKHRPLIIFEQNKEDFTNGNSKVIDQIYKMNYQIFWIDNNFPRTKNSLHRIIYTFTGFLFGKKLTIRSGIYPPAKPHPFLIAVPNK